jgi:glycerol kinase
MTAPSNLVLAVDAGTTGVRTVAVDESGTIVARAYREFPQYFPSPGRVEHDAEEIWAATQATLAEVCGSLPSAPVALGITNQRETIVAWSRSTSRPLARAVVWQDRRTAARCDQLEALGVLPLVRSVSGLVLDPYFSASKIEWLFTSGGITPTADVAIGTVDSWLVHKLTGGASHLTDATNASRTMLFDLDALAWSPELCDLFGVPGHVLPEVRPSSGTFGVTTAEAACGPGIAIAGVAGDQHAALFGQACFAPGDAKNTYGTGSFVLMNVGTARPEPVDGLLTTIAWVLDGPTGPQPTYALEGAIFITGAAVQWLRDGLGMIDDASELEPLARQCASSGGVYFVPAFTGLGSPWWDPYARGTLIGVTRGTGRPEIARATIEAMAHQTRDVVDAMEGASGQHINRLRVDGGASANTLLLELQADQLGVPVQRPVTLETTALGAAYLAGLAAGVWGSLDDITARWRLDVEVEPSSARADADAAHAGWLRALERSRHWLQE